MPTGGARAGLAPLAPASRKWRVRLPAALADGPSQNSRRDCHCFITNRNNTMINRS